jgi:hypothetical protein
VVASADELAKLPPADRANPCKTGLLYQRHKQYDKARADLEACLGGGDNGPLTSAYTLVFVTMEQGDFKACYRYLAQLRAKNPELYKNVKHLETMLPVDD